MKSKAAIGPGMELVAKMIGKKVGVAHLPHKAKGLPKKKLKLGMSS